MMYLDSKDNRVLLQDGKSIVTPWQYAKYLIEERDVSNLSVLESPDAQKYDYLYGTALSSDVYEVEVAKEVEPYTDEDISYILNRIEESDRYNTSYDERISLELDYFQRSENIPYILKLIELIDKFKQDKIVWGVGRGSSCASVLMYILHVNDIDPVLYDIPFSELSKE